MEPLLHPTTAAQLRAAQTTPGVGYIFHGAASVGKAAAAFALARRLNCQGDEPKLCVSCRQFEAGSYPDFLYLKPEDKPSITIEQVRGLTQTLSLSLYHPGSVRVVVIDAADQLTVQAQNALLKLIEEPPVSTRFILIAARPEALLPTVRSRLGVIYFAPVAEAEIEAHLVSNYGVAGDEAARLAALAEGAPGRAIALADRHEAAEAELELATLAEDTLRLSLFERLVMVKRLIDTKANLPLLAHRLHQVVMGQLRAGESPALAANRLEAIEWFRRQLAAGVNARVAAERLMVEL